MTCADCGEGINEVERKAGVHCSGCRKLMHHECLMVGPEGESFCEECCFEEDRQFYQRMFSKGVLA